MPELSVTEEQLERIEGLRADLEAAFVEGYGHVRRRDAVDYLLDTHAPPVEERVRSALDRTVRDEEGAIDYPALQSVARNTEGVKGSGMTAEEMYEAVLEAKVREAEAGHPVDVGAGSGDRTEADASGGVDDPGADGAPGADGGGGSIDAGTDTAEGDTDEVDDPEADGSEADDSSGTESTDGEEKPGSVAGDAASNGGSQLQQMMSLLNTHDDKWRTAESGDAPYEVDLPDGGTKSARTKDDVKRILFTNY
ncbi:MAG: hypothetical protein V5A62_01945 [Haloarculaceae archaeon]